jgi:hypothetical protein
MKIFPYNPLTLTLKTMQKIITLLAGYAAGLAVAMKYRKDAGTSTLTHRDPNTSRLDSFIDEIVGIHKSAFADIKSVVSITFEEVDDFDTLKARVNTLIEGFAQEVEGQIDKIKTQ